MPLPPRKITRHQAWGCEYLMMSDGAPRLLRWDIITSHIAHLNTPTNNTLGNQQHNESYEAGAMLVAMCIVDFVII